MGIQDLLISIAKHFPDVKLTQCYLGAFGGCRVAIDISIYAYKFMAVARKESLNYCDYLNENPDPNTLRSFWLEKIFNFLMLFVEENVTPIVVFDGPPFRLKHQTKEDRRSKYETRAQEIKVLRKHNIQYPMDRKKLQELKTKLSYHVSFSRDDWLALKLMIRTMGLPLIEANIEAEALCARLVREGKAIGVVTNDGDALAHLSSIMIIDVKGSVRHGRPMHKCTCIILQNVLASLKMTETQFVDFCMLLGTDYNDRIKGFGWKLGLRELRECETLEATIRSIAVKKEDKKAAAIERGKPWNERSFNEYRLAHDNVIKEIRGYFLSSFALNIANDHDQDITLHYEEGLPACFDKLFTSFNRKRMLEKVESVEQQLWKFNQIYASMQEFQIIEVNK